MPAYPQHLSFSHKEERPWQNSRLSHGCIVGHTTTTSTKIWVRVHEAGDYTLVLHTSPLKGSYKTGNQWFDKNGQAFIPVNTLTLSIDESTLLTGVFDVDAASDGGIQPLTADTCYYYGIQFNGEWVLGVEKNNCFNTLADDGQLTFGFYSCNMPFKKLGLFEGVGAACSIENWSNLRDVLSRLQADFVIGGGDQVYSDGHDKISLVNFLKKYKDEILALDEATQLEIMRSWYDDIYRGYWGFSSVRSVFSHFPHYMTWDDHEIMDGWGSYEKDALELLLKDGVFETPNERQDNRKLLYRLFDAASEAFYYYQHSHNPTTNITALSVKDRASIPQRKWHYDYTAKGSAFFVMDTRGHKSIDSDDPNYEGQPTLLGHQQIDDFKAWLQRPETIQAKALFIVSAVPFVHWKQYVIDLGEVTNFKNSRDDVRDEWDHPINHDERNEILDLIFNFSQGNGNKKVFLLSGDVHCAASFQLRKKESDARVYQLTSSAITYAKNLPSWLVKKQVEDTGLLSGRNDIEFKRISPVEAVNNFSTITVEPAADDVLVHFDLYGRPEKDKGMLMYERLSM